MITAEKGMEQIVLNIGRSFFKEITTTRLWNAKHGGVYVAITEETQPNPYLDVPNRDVITTTGLRLTKINPAFMTRQIAEIAKQESNIQYHITSLKPIRSANRADEWETLALSEFENGANESFQLIQNALVYRYMAPLPTKEACLKCHSKQGYKLGDIRGGISLSIPAKVYIDTLKKSKNSLMLIHLVVLALGAGFFSFLTRYRDEKEQKIKQKNKELEKEIEERKKIENALGQSEKQFRLLYESAPLPYQSLDCNGHFLDVNQAWLDTLGGYTKDEVIGRSFGDFLLSDWGEHFKYNFPRSKDTGKVLRGEFEMVKKDDSVILAHFNGNVAYDEQGNFLQTHCIFQDITQHREDEKAMRKSKEEWEKTFDAMSDIVTIQDKNMRIIRANKAAHQFFQAEYGELTDKHCYEVFRGKSEPCSGCPLLDTLRDAAPHLAVMTYENLGKTFQVSSSAITSENGEVQYLIHVVKDITEQKRLEEELFQAHKMEAIGDLAGGIAHDFNNMLAAILGCAEFIQEEVPKESKIGKNIAEILTAGNRAADLVRQILTFSRQEASEKQVLQPHLIVKEALKMLRATLPTTVTIEEDIDPDCGRIVADPTIIHQIVVNLCSNGLQSMAGQKGTLQIGLKRRELSATDISARENVSPGSFVVLTVKDNGCGMNLRTIERIFEPYFTTKEVGRGTGLGLAIIHGAVENYKGFIEVESSVGKGTVFSIYFPLTEEPVTRTVALEQEDRGKVLPANARILVVDDELLLVKINERRLKSCGYQVTAVTDSKEALEIFRSQQENFDLLITDQTMPGLTGAELAKAVLEIKPSLPIIMCTGHSDVVSGKEAIAMGIKKYVFKPLHGDELLDAVQEVLGKKQ